MRLPTDSSAQNPSDFSPELISEYSSKVLISSDPYPYLFMNGSRLLKSSQVKCSLRQIVNKVNQSLNIQIHIWWISRSNLLEFETDR